MRKSISRKITTYIPVLLAIFLFRIACPRSTFADTWTYSYQGNNFNQFAGGYSCPPECALSGWITLDAPLGDSLSHADIDPSSFYFTDGAITWTASDVSSESFSFYTDGSGNITGWYTGAAIGTPPLQTAFDSQGGMTTLGAPINALDDSVICDGPGPCLAGAEVFDNPGTWTVTVNTPESSTISMFFSGLLGLGLLFVVKRDGKRSTGRN